MPNPDFQDLWASKSEEEMAKQMKEMGQKLMDQPPFDFAIPAKVYDPESQYEEIKSQKRSYSPEVVKSVREWLGKDGVDFFRGVLKKHGKIAAVWMEGRIPHSVHFNEGMQVRNFLRGVKECKDWNAHELDDTWAEIVKDAISDSKESC